MKIINLNLKRYIFNTEGDRSTIGDLFINDEFFCFTLEDEIRPGGQKVYGKTAIPAGTYEVVLTVSNRFKRLMPLLVNVPNFEGVRIHGGNTAEHTHGCPLVAYNTDKVKIWGTAEKDLTARLKAFKDENPEGKIFIKVENNPLSYNGKA